MAKSLKAKPKNLRKTREVTSSLVINKAYCPPETYPIKGGMMSVMADGLKVAWSTCGRCHSHVTHCKCQGGLRAPRSVEYIYDRSVADANKEEWSIYHKHYKGSFSLPERERQQKRWDARVSRNGPVRRADPKPVKKTLSKKTLDVSKVDVETVNKAAASDASATTKQLKGVLKSLSKTKGKSLRKKG